MLQCERMTMYRRTRTAANVNAVAAAASSLSSSSSSSSTFTLPSHTTIIPSPRGAMPMPFNSNSRFRFTASTPTSFFKYDAPWLHYDNNNNSDNNTNRTGTGSTTPSILNFINGNFESNKATSTTTTAIITAMDDQRIIPIYNPSTNNQLSYISESSSSSNENTATATTSILRAIEAAKQAFPSWSNTPVQNRQRYLLEYAHLLHTKEVREEIA